MKPYTLFLFTNFLFTNLLMGQSRTAYVLIKEKKGEHWYCPNQQISFKTHFISKDLSHDKHKKTLNVFKERLLAGDTKNYRIKERTVYMQQQDYLVFYTYKFQYKKESNSNCSKNYSSIIKVFSTNDPSKINKKLEQKIKGSMFPEKAYDYKVIDVTQPFKDNTSLLQKLSKHIRTNYIDSTKVKRKTKDATVGVRG